MKAFSETENRSSLVSSPAGEPFRTNWHRSTAERSDGPLRFSVRIIAENKNHLLNLEIQLRSSAADRAARDSKGNHLGWFPTYRAWGLLSQERAPAGRLHSHEYYDFFSKQVEVQARASLRERAGNRNFSRRSDADECYYYHSEKPIAHRRHRSRCFGCRRGHGHRSCWDSDVEQHAFRSEINQSDRGGAVPARTNNDRAGWERDDAGARYVAPSGYASFGIYLQRYAVGQHPLD
jgi:hypothetical protein